MTKQDTLPPLPELRARFQFWYGNDLLAAPVHQSREDRQWAAFQAGARAALAAQAPQPKPKLTKEARVGGTTFGIGVPERFVVEAAQRAAEHPQGLVDKEAAGAFQRLIQENAERAAFLEAHPAITKELCDLIEENEKLKSIVAQAPQPIPLVSVGEDGEGQENHCPECGAEPGQMCSDEEGAEHGRKVHAVRQAPQQAETIAVQEAWEAAGGNPGIKATKADLLASLRLLDAVCDEAGAQEDRRKAQGVAAEWKLAAFPIEWTPGGNWFNDWIGQWFGPDADDDYIRKAVQSLLAAAPQAAPAPSGYKLLEDGKTMIPEGWTWCRIEYEPGYPEDVAFGPERMMARLKKWLDRYFASKVAAANRDWMAELGFSVRLDSGVLLLVDDCGNEREATLNERVLWDALIAAPAPAPQALTPLSADLLNELSREMVKGKKSVNWLAASIERACAEQWGINLSGIGAASAPQALTEREPTTWSRYVAGMIAGYLKWPDDDERVEAVAGIIERRRWTEPKPEMAPMSPDQSASFQWLERLCEPSLYLDRLGPIRDYLRAHGIKAASAGGEG